MRIEKIVSEDRVDIGTLTGVAGSLPFTFTQLNSDGTEGAPVDITGVTPLVEVTNGPPEIPGNVLLLTLNEGNGGITRDNLTGTFTLHVTMSQMTTLLLGDYAWRFLFFESAECVDRPLYGAWNHRKGR